MKVLFKDEYGFLEVSQIIDFGYGIYDDFGNLVFDGGYFITAENVIYSVATHSGCVNYLCSKLLDDDYLDLRYYDCEVFDYEKSE